MTGKERAIKAKAITNLYKEEFPELIQKSIDGTKIYRNNTKFRELVEKSQKPSKKSILFELTNAEGAAAIKNVLSIPVYQDKKIAVLNPANYKNAGGKFLEGIWTPEADLCQNSYLYNVLTAFDKEYYIPNQRMVNKSLYTDSALYTPDINFFLFSEDKDLPARKNVDVISCSPPNMKAYYTKAHRWNYFNLYNKIIFQRLTFIRDICELNDIEILIIGPWGLTNNYCGSAVFLTSVIDKIFKNSSSLEKIIFGISKEKICFEKTMEMHNKERRIKSNEIKEVS